MKHWHLTTAALLGTALLLNGCGGSDGGTAAPVDPVEPVVPFEPSASDVTDPDSHYTYPKATAPVTDPSVANVKITYSPTYVSGAGYYLVDENTCEYLASPPASYPDDPNTPAADNLITLDTVNLDVNDTDACVPEIKVNFQADGYPVVATANAKMRMRGSSTRLADQKSYRVKLNSKSPCITSTVPCWRNDEITLQFNKHPYDLARVRNKLAFDLMRDIPHINSLRTQFAHITYNDGSADSDLGLFTHVEKMGKEYLLNRGYAPTSNIYKANEFYFESDTRLDVDPTISGSEFESVLEVENDSGDHMALRAMVTALNDDSVDFNTTFDTYFNRNNYLTWLATNILFGNHDTLTQNFALYQPAGGNRFYFLPWDYDGSLGFEDQPNELAEGDLYDDWQLGLANWWGSPLHRRFMQEPGNLALIKAAVKEVRDQYLLAAQVQSRIDSYKTLVETLITSAPDLQDLPTYSASPLTDAQQWADEYQRLTTTVQTNYDRFISRLQNPMPYWQAAAIDTTSGKLVLEWDASFDLQKNPVTYSIKVATDPAFTAGSVIFSKTGLSTTLATTTAPAAGTYYMQVVARDSEGHTTHAFDRTDVGNSRYFGVLQFTLP